MRANKTYTAALVLVFAALAWVRSDLTIGAMNTASAGLAAGWVPGAKIVFGVLLLGFILVMTARIIAADADPAMDALVVSAASLYGYLAELAGTTTGLWTYYTGERPPLWIVPAWPIGAIVVMRLARGAEAAYEKLFGGAAAAGLYWAWVVLFYAVFVPFTAPMLTAAESLFAASVTAAVLLPGGRRGRDFRLLLTGTLCVFWADLWGTTNHCWVYHTRGSAAGEAAGILFGMLFNSALILASVKTGETLKGLAARLRARIR